jgi:hypothetical protein
MEVVLRTDGLSKNNGAVTASGRGRVWRPGIGTAVYLRKEEGLRMAVSCVS